MQREKQEAEARISEARARLSHSNTRYRVLRDERAAVVSRVSAAAAELDRLAVSTPQAPHCTTQPHFASPAIARQPSTEQPHPKARWPRAHRPASVIPAFGFGAGIYASTHTPVRDIASYCCCSAITLADITAHLPPGSDLLGSRDAPQCIPQAIREFQAAASVALGAPRDDICWFIQFPQRVSTGQPLSHSASIASPECQMSLMLFGEALALEAGLLLEQHKGLVCEAAAEAPADVAQRSDGEAASPPQPTPPSPAARAQRIIRCGVNATCTLAEAVGGVIAPIVRRYARTLRRCVWRSVCCKALRKAQASLAALRQAADEQASAGASSADSRTEAGGPGPQVEGSGGGAAVAAAASSCEAGPPTDNSGVSCSDASNTAEGSSTGDDGCADELQQMHDLLAVVAHCIWSEMQADAALGPVRSHVPRAGLVQCNQCQREVHTAPHDASVVPHCVTSCAWCA